MRVGSRITLLAGAVFLMASGQVMAAPSDIQWPDTGQEICYNNAGGIVPCASTQYPGQDASHDGPSSALTDNGNETVSDGVTGLLWQLDGSDSGKLSLADAQTYVDGLTLPGCTDWDLPTAQELSSLVDSSFDATGDDHLGTYGPFTLNNEYNPTHWTKTPDPVGAADDRMVLRFRAGVVMGSSLVPGPHNVLAVCRD